MLLRAWIGVWAMVMLVGCGLVGLPEGRFPSEAISVPEGQAQYSTEQRPGGVIGGVRAAELRAEVAALLARRGGKAEADGSLAATASWVLAEVHDGRPIDLVGSERAARHFGFGGVLVTVVVFDTRTDPWREQLEKLPGNIPITRFGIRVSPSGASAAVAFGTMELDYTPIPKQLEPGQSVALRGQIGERFAFSHLYLTKPDGSVEEKRMPGRAIDAAFVLAEQGLYRLEVMGDGATGPVVVANVPLFVGIPEPVVDGIAGDEVPPGVAEQRMLALLNGERRKAGLAELLADPELRSMALAHSSDMAENHFFGHVSPKTGSPEDRAKRAAPLISISGENVALAATPEVAHEGLMSSPGHRANMLRPEFTHVGIGATQGDSGLLVTLVFGRRPSADAVPASAAQVESAIATLREQKSLPKANVDPIYRAGAQAGAEVWAKGGGTDEMTRAIGDTIQSEVTRQRTNRPAACITAFDLLELAQLRDLPSLTLPGLRRFGVGARLRRDAKGARLSTVLMLEGVPCR